MRFYRLIPPPLPVIFFTVVSPRLSFERKAARLRRYQLTLSPLDYVQYYRKYDPTLFPSNLVAKYQNRCKEISSVPVVRVAASTPLMRSYQSTYQYLLYGCFVLFCLVLCTITSRLFAAARCGLFFCHNGCAFVSAGRGECKMLYKTWYTTTRIGGRAVTVRA